MVGTLTMVLANLAITILDVSILFTQELITDLINLTSYKLTSFPVKVFKHDGKKEKTALKWRGKVT